MKIVISPSKTMNPCTSKHLSNRGLLFPKEHKKVLSTLRKLSKSKVSEAYNIKDTLLDQTYHNIKNYSANTEMHAFESFTGLVYFNLQKDSYTAKEYTYIEDHVRILDAFYGVLEPGTLIKPYRLDMKTKLGFNLYIHWDVNSYFMDDVVLNLASNEFSKMLNVPMISVHFLQEINGTYKNQATYSKQARGLFLNYMILNEIKDLEKLKEFMEDGYQFNKEQSDSSNLTFTRSKR